MESPESTPRLYVESGPRGGTEFELTPDLSCTIGSDSACDLQLTGPGVAEQHLVIKALKDGGFGAKCLDHPFTLNQRATEAARLNHGDLLELGGTRIRFADRADAPPRESDVASVIGGFRLEGVLGAGGMGTVYQAEQVSLNRKVALKVLNKELTSDPVFVARFVAEARAAARLHHPNVVQVFDVGHEGDTFFYSMEVMHKGSLEERLKELGKLDVTEALEVVASAARGLSYAESLRIVHRDIKPDNLMLDLHGNVKIADLGLALTDEDNVSKIIGTPHFMSPEQAMGKPLDHRSDLYSLGCTFYRLLTGRTPFRRDTVKEILRAHVKETAEPVNKVSPEVPAEVAAIVDRLLKKAPDDRYQSAADLVEDIEAVLAPTARKGLLIASIAVAVVVAGLGLAWGLTRPEGKTETKIIEKLDPRTAAYAEKLRQADAEIARLSVLLSGVEGRALVAALKQMAEAHPDTDAAATAQRDAAASLAEIERIEKQAAARALAIRQAETDLRQSAAQAIAAGDYRRAATLVVPSALPEDMRGEAVLIAAIDELKRELRQRADADLARLEQDLEQAKAARQTAAVSAALAKLDAIVAPESGWPELALPDRGALAAHAKDGRQFLVALQRELAVAAETEAWAEYRAGMLGPEGVLAGIDRFDPAAAAAAAKQVADALAGQPPEARARELSVGLARADSFLRRFQDAVAAGSLSYMPRDGENDGRPGAVAMVAFAPRGEQPGLTVKFGPPIRSKHELLGLASLRGPRLPEIFQLAEPESNADPERAAFLGWMALSDQLAVARKYLARVSPKLPESGTGSEAYPGEADVLSKATDVLRNRQEPWARALCRELVAADLAVRALQAFSSKRYLSAANHVDRLLGEFGETLVAASLSRS